MNHGRLHVDVARRLNEFMLALVEVAVRERARKAHWAEQQRLRGEAERRQNEENQRIKAFETEAARQKSRQFRAYVMAVERQAKRNGLIK